MASLVSLSTRAERRPVCTQDDSDDDNFVPNKDQTTEQVEGIAEREAVKLMDDHPGKPVFAERIIERFPGLRRGNFSNEEHDKILLRAVSKHGFGNWIPIVSDQEFGIQWLICIELNVPFSSLTPTDPNQRDPQRKIGDVVRRRFEILEKAMKNECAEDYYYRILDRLLMTEPTSLFCDQFQQRTERLIQNFASENISMSLSAIRNR